MPALVSFVLVLGWSGDADLAAAAGPEQGALLGMDALEQAQFKVTSDDPARLEAAEVTLDGKPVSGAQLRDGALVWRPPAGLDEGRHRVEVVINRRFPIPDRKASWTFVVDKTPPSLDLDVPDDPVPYDEAITLEGTVEDGASVAVEGADVQVEGEQVEVSFVAPPVSTFEVVATDAAGNDTVLPVRIPVELPKVKAVHMTALAWKADSLREPVLQMIEEGRINAVELDIKDESGVIGYDSQVPLAREIGAVQPAYDAKEAIAQLHEKGVRVIGRIVVFRDPVLAKYAWENGQRERVIQTPGGGFYGKYGGFTNFADEVVRDYNIDVAVEAAELGFDEILYDYIRRPDGDIDGMVFPGLDVTPEESIVSFLAESRSRLQGTGALQGASVFGIAVTRPLEIAQDIPEMAKHVDYIAPMVYPSHWAKGEYKVANPNAQPYDIVHASMQDYLKAVEGTDARIVPWLQDFTLGVTYGPREVKAQIDAARDAGIDEWILWDPRCTYTAAALERNAFE